MEKTSLLLAFNCEGIDYSGWATPSERVHEDGHPASYSVVLNQIFFGDISRDRGKWVLDGQRPHKLTLAVGKCLDKIFSEPIAAYS